MGKLTIIVASMGLCLQGALSSTAQAPPATQATPTVRTSPQDSAGTSHIRLSPRQLQAYAGYFQFSRYNKWVLRVKAVESGLMVKSLWLLEEVRLTPLSDSTFFSPHGFGGDSMTITFGKKKNKEGEYEQLALGDIPSWDRVYGYKPYEPVAIRLTPGQLKAFEGLYQGVPDSGLLMFIKAKPVENKLLAMRLWANAEFEAIPDSALHFFEQENLAYTLQFKKGQGDSISELTFADVNHFAKVNSPSLTPARMKTFEGKYRLKDDADDIILITARDLRLVVKQLWDGKETIVDPLADFFFYNSAQKYSATFRKDPTGAIIGVMILNKDFFERVKD